MSEGRRVPTVVPTGSLITARIKALGLDARSSSQVPSGPPRVAKSDVTTPLQKPAQAASGPIEPQISPYLQQSKTQNSVQPLSVGRKGSVHANWYYAEGATPRYVGHNGIKDELEGDKHDDGLQSMGLSKALTGASDIEFTQGLAGTGLLPKKMAPETQDTVADNEMLKVDGIIKTAKQFQDSIDEYTGKACSAATHESLDAFDGHDVAAASSPMASSPMAKIDSAVDFQNDTPDEKHPQDTESFEEFTLEGLYKQRGYIIENSEFGSDDGSDDGSEDSLELERDFTQLTSYASSPEPSLMQPSAIGNNTQNTSTPDMKFPRRLAGRFSPPTPAPNSPLPETPGTPKPTKRPSPLPLERSNRSAVLTHNLPSDPVNQQPSSLWPAPLKPTPKLVQTIFEEETLDPSRQTPESLNALLKELEPSRVRKGSHVLQLARNQPREPLPNFKFPPAAPLEQNSVGLGLNKATPIKAPEYSYDNTFKDDDAPTPAKRKVTFLLSLDQQDQKPSGHAHSKCASVMGISTFLATSQSKPVSPGPMKEAPLHTPIIAEEEDANRTQELAVYVEGAAYDARPLVGWTNIGPLLPNQIKDLDRQAAKNEERWAQNMAEEAARIDAESKLWLEKDQLRMKQEKEAAKPVNKLVRGLRNKCSTVFNRQRKNQVEGDGNTTLEAGGEYTAFNEDAKTSFD